jgi:PhnB protein
MATRHVPEGYHTATPYLIMDDAARAIDFYKRAFGANELLRYDAPGGKIGHAEVKVGDSVIMLADEYPDMGYRSPKAIGGTPVSIMLYIDDVDAQFKQAVAAGATALRPVADQFYGDRSGTLEDPFGHVWTLATHVEDLSHEEILRRAEAASKAKAAERPQA